jgi:serine-type D-Ala-D-Ala carboxypeptidase/endopeptidase (penicillin-binding protein 4)
VRRSLIAALALTLTCAVACTPASSTQTHAVSSAPVSAPTASAVPSSRPSSDASTPSIVVRPAGAPWTAALDRIVATPGVAVAVGVGNRIEYEHAGDQPMTLASNEKLLTSMAALEVLGETNRFTTIAAAATGTLEGRVVHGDLWLVGGGDPTLDGADLGTLASKIADAGVARITGEVVGDTSAFSRMWWAPGWLPGISRSFVARPVALRLSTSRGALESAAAGAFREALVAAGVEVAGSTTGVVPADARTLAAIASPTLAQLLSQQNHESDNLYAELLTKALGDESGRAASTNGGARVIQRWAASEGVRSSVRDGSGLSGQDRTSAIGVVWLLLRGQEAPWFPVFERSLPAGGEGTLAARLTDVPVRAKTGTLFVRPTSTLSGYVNSANGSRVAFSVLTRDLPQATAEGIEDAVVRTLAGATVR